MNHPLCRDILEKIDLLAAAVYQRQTELQADLPARLTAAGQEDMLRTTARTLRYLAQSIDLESPVIFSDYIDWLKVILESREQPVRDLRFTLHCIQQELTFRYLSREANLIAEYLDAGRAELEKTMPNFYATELRGEHAGLARQYLEAVLLADQQLAGDIIHGAAAAGTRIDELRLQVLQPVQHELGRLWQFHKIDCEQVNTATQITAGLLDQLRAGEPQAAALARKVAAVCPPGEDHRLGLQVAMDFLTRDGWEVVFLDGDTQVDLMQSFRAAQPDLLAISVTLAVHLDAAAELIDAVRRSQQQSIKILAGGAAFSLVPYLWRRIGADGCAADADAGARIVRGWWGHN